MGVKIYELCPATELGFDALRGKALAIDAYLFLYQFLSTIRSRDGALLTDSKGQVTSHLVGLLSRTTNFMRQGIQPCYVFDGTPPKLKQATIKARADIKKEAQRQYEEAAAVQDVEGMRKFASRTSRLTKDMVEEAKGVIRALGLPVVEAPSEGEAQAAYIAKQGDVWAVASQDADSLLFGAPRLVRNLTVSGKRKKPGTLIYEEISPQLIELKKVLSHLNITQEQLLVLAMLVGTDYNPGGVRGIGPNKALKLVTQHGKNYATLFKEVKWDDHCDVGWRELLDTFKTMPVTDKYDLKWRSPDQEALKKLLCDKHDFSEERVARAVSGLASERKARSQQTLGSF